MFARVSRYHGSPGMVQEGARVVQDITSELQQMPGNQGGYLLVDGRSGEAVSISLWGTEEEMHRSTQGAGPLRDRTARALGATGTPTVETFEVGAEIVHRAEGARFARLSEYHGSPDKVDEGIRTMSGMESSLTQMEGFHRVYLFADRKSGKGISISFWDSEDALNRSAPGVNPLRDRIAQALGATDRPTIEAFEVAGEIPQRMRRAA